MAASTALAGITGALGITLPFVAYTGLSTAIATALGPIGWIGAGILAVFTLSGPNDRKLVPTIVYIAMLRADMEHRRTTGVPLLPETPVQGINLRLHS
jgi:uncharacterized protein YaaW (UPF0174 family)